MNLNLLKKLVKLANNNPNENEANAVARKACKIIEEGKFQFHSSGPNWDKHTNDLSDIIKKANSSQHKQEPGSWHGFRKYKPIYQSTCSKCGKIFQHPQSIPISSMCYNCLRANFSPFVDWDFTK